MRRIIVTVAMLIAFAAALTGDVYALSVDEANRILKEAAEVSENPKSKQEMLDSAAGLKEIIPVYTAAGDDRRKGEALMSLGRISHFSCDYLSGMRSYQEAMADFSRAGYEAGVGKCLRGLGELQLQVGATKEAMKAFEQARLIAERTKDAKALGESLFLLCSGMGLMERKEEAQRLCMKALEVSREARDIETEGRTLVNLSMDYDDTATAIEMIQTAIEGCRTLNNRSCEAEPTAVMGLMLMKQGEKEKAVEAFDKVMELGTQLDSGEMKSVALIGLGLIQLQSGSFPEGLKSLEQGREIAAAIGNLQLEQMFATTLTPVYATLRRPEEVKRLLDRVGELAILMGNVGQYVNTVTGTAKLYLTQGNLDAATAACASLLDKADRIENKDAVKEVTLTLSQIYEIAGQDEKAKEYKDKAEKIPSGPEGAR